MLLTIDAGNTNIKLSVFQNNQLIAATRAATHQQEYKSIILSFLYRENIRNDAIEDTIIACVVPDILKRLKKDLITIMGKEPILIDPKVNTCGLKMTKQIQSELGADLLIMSSYAYDLFKQELLIVSMGTASVISHISEDGEFQHCIIAPGFAKMASALWTNAALLPELEMEKRNSFLATNTKDAMTVGIYDGYIGMMKYLIKGLERSLTKQPLIIGCGGYGKQLVPYIKDIKHYQPDLVTTGLNHIYEKYYHQ